MPAYTRHSKVLDRGVPLAKILSSIIDQKEGSPLKIPTETPDTVVQTRDSIGNANRITAL